MKSPCEVCSSHSCICQRHSTSAYDNLNKGESPHGVLSSTPDKKNNFRHPVASPLHTIRESPCSRSSGFNISTPSRSYRITRNPFDTEVESLQTSSFSPSVFAITRRGSEENSSFRWSIEQLAVLKPADIDENSQQDVHVDWEKEIKAQKAIDAFFSKNNIVPSPWGPTVKCSSFAPDLASTAYNCSSDFQKSSNVCKNEHGDSSDANTVSTQTMLTIPPNIDLMTLLRPFCTYQVESMNDSVNSSGSDVDMLSNSSLRRKLFMNDDDDDCLHAQGNKDLEENNNVQKCFTPDKKTNLMVATPASDHFSSSPITPRNFSLSMNCPRSSLSSPNISPIRASIQKLYGSAGHSEASELGNKFANDDNADEKSYSSSGIQNHDGSQPSVIMKSMSDNGSSSFCSSEVEFCDPAHRGNPENDGNQTSFPDSSSTNRDTGYLTGSLSFVPSMNFQQNSGCIPLRTTPVIELLGGCAITKTQNGTMDDSRTSSSNAGDISLMSIGQVDSVDRCVASTELNLGAWHPNKYSTPSKIYRS